MFSSDAGEVVDATGRWHGGDQRPPKLVPRVKLDVALTDVQRLTVVRTDKTPHENQERTPTSDGDGCTILSRLILLAVASWRYFTPRGAKIRHVPTADGMRLPAVTSRKVFPTPEWQAA